MSQTTPGVLSDHPSTADLEESERHRLLEVDRRRHALFVLADRADPIGLEALSTAVAEREADVDADDADAVASVATTLHHIHLPKMADAGVVKYDATDKRVTR